MWRLVPMGQDSLYRSGHRRAHFPWFPCHRRSLDIPTIVPAQHTAPDPQRVPLNFLLVARQRSRPPLLAPH